MTTTFVFNNLRLAPTDENVGALREIGQHLGQARRGEPDALDRVRRLVGEFVPTPEGCVEITFGATVTAYVDLAAGRVAQFDVCAMPELGEEMELESPDELSAEDQDQAREIVARSL